MTEPRNRMGAASILTTEAPNANLRLTSSLLSRWAETNGIDVAAAPDPEQLLLRFLHTNRGALSWRAGTCTEYARGVAQHLMILGYEDPRGTRYAAWIRAVRRHEADAPPERCPALTPSTIKDAVAGEPMQGLDQRTIRLRGVIAVAGALGIDPTIYGTPCQRLHRDDFEVRADGVVVTGPDGTRRLLDGHRQPLFVAALVEALSGCADYPLAEPQTNEHERPSVRDSRMLRQAWDRSRPPGSSKAAASAAAWRSAWGAATAQDRIWWLMSVDPDYFMVVQTRAYLLFGVTTAHRHATMQRLSIGHLVPTPTGYAHTARTSEHKSGRRARGSGHPRREIHKSNDHLGEAGTGCPPYCDACALDLHLAARRHKGAADSDPLWVTATPYGAALNRAGAARNLRALVANCDLDTDDKLRVGTRSLRVTAATLARRSGMSYSQIAADVTDHVKAATAEIYVRHADPFDESRTLELNG
ncbi:hypothetical protein ACFQW6_00740 [Nocardioides sp. GCM10028917]|uniref:hypothetical protein n=1 Tax=Nocardioides sp. GCM10028917 TaxID=3273408 RepID=UPI003617BD85